MTLYATREGDIVTIQYSYGPAVFKLEEHIGHTEVFLHELTRVVGEPVELRAKKGYDRYVIHCGGVSIHGEPLPQWKNQSEEIQQHWIAAFTE